MQARQHPGNRRRVRLPDLPADMGIGQPAVSRADKLWGKAKRTQKLQRPRLGRRIIGKQGRGCGTVIGLDHSLANAPKTVGATARQRQPWLIFQRRQPVNHGSLEGRGRRGHAPRKLGATQPGGKQSQPPRRAVIFFASTSIPPSNTRVGVAPPRASVTRA